MTPHRITEPRPEIALKPAHVTDLISAIGTPGFIGTVMDIAHAICGAEFVSIFCQGDRDTPLLIGTTCRLGQRRADRAAKAHRRYLDQDPNTAILAGDFGDGDFLISQLATEIVAFPYRRDCYDGPGISGRISWARRRASYGITVSLYSGIENGPFGRTAQERATALLAPLVDATERHVAFSLKGQKWMEQDIQARLALTYPDLTPREREVAAMAIKGRTARESADLLGLSETTIITHRKRAYKRMNVTSLRHLMGTH